MITAPQRVRLRHNPRGGVDVDGGPDLSRTPHYGMISNSKNIVTAHAG
jgi:hypothetical protein